MGQAKVKVIEETLGSKPQLWKHWGWKAIEQTSQRTVLEGFYRTPHGPIRGQVEIISSADAAAIRFYVWDEQQRRFLPRCVQAASVEQGILTLQSVMKPHQQQKGREGGTA